MQSISLFLIFVIVLFLVALVTIVLIWLCYVRTSNRAHTLRNSHLHSVTGHNQHRKLSRLQSSRSSAFTTTATSVVQPNRNSSVVRSCPESNHEIDQMSKKSSSSFTSYLIDSDLEPLVGRDSPTKQFQAKSNPINRPILWDEFAGYCQQNHRDTNFGFSEEFLELEQICQETLYNSIPRAQNRLFKNRYANIVPYSHSMVKLDKIEGERFSDYINANFIPGLNGQREYIACQGPLSSTIADFHRMLLQYRVPIIVSLCRIGPERECSRYFPNLNDPHNEEQLNGITTRIELLESKTHSDLTTNIVQFVQDQDKVVHRLRQFHYTVWKDFSTPDSIKSLLDLVQTVHHYSLKLGPNSGPIVVHCSAGVGRTGTYIAIHQLWQIITRQFKSYYPGGTLGSEAKLTDNSTKTNSSTSAKSSPSSSPKTKSKSSNISPILAPCIGKGKNKSRHRKVSVPSVKPSVDIFGLVYNMRKYRAIMVQSEDQYVFLYDCVNYLLTNRVELTKPETEVNQIAENGGPSSVRSELNENLSVVVEANYLLTNRVELTKPETEVNKIAENGGPSSVRSDFNQNLSVVVDDEPTLTKL